MKAIDDHYRDLSPSYADQIMTGITRVTRLLETLPRMGRTVPEFGDETLRELIVRRYRVVYSFDGDVCKILAVIDSRRDFKTAFDPEQPDPLE